MARQLDSLFTHLRDMTDEQLQQNISEIRRRKFHVRPAAANRKAAAEKPARKAKNTKVTKLVAAMSDDERAKLIALLEQEDSNEQ